RHVAGEDQHRRPRRVRGGDCANHVGKARALSAGSRRYFTSHPGERVSGMTHRSFVAPGISRYSLDRDRILDVVVSRTTEKRRQTFFLTDSGEHLCPGHWEAGLGARSLRRLSEFVRDLYRSAIRGIGAVRCSFAHCGERRGSHAGKGAREECPPRAFWLRDSVLAPGIRSVLHDVSIL